MHELQSDSGSQQGPLWALASATSYIQRSSHKK